MEDVYKVIRRIEERIAEVRRLRSAQDRKDNYALSGDCRYE